MEQYDLNGIQFSRVIGGRMKNNRVVAGYSHTNLTRFSGNMQIALDANIMTSAILNKEFYSLLCKESKDCPIFITEISREETRGNLEEEGYSKEEAIAKFENFKKDLNITILPSYEGCESDATILFNKVMSDKSIKIKRIKTFLPDCTTLVILDKNNVNVFYSNDENLGEVCEKFLPCIQVRKILDEKELRIKEIKKANKMFKDILPKFKYRGQRHRLRR